MYIQQNCTKIANIQYEENISKEQTYERVLGQNVVRQTVVRQNVLGNVTGDKKSLGNNGLGQYVLGTKHPWGQNVLGDKAS